MKSKRETTLFEIEDVEDDDFLSQVAKAEFDALSASDFKRRKITTVDFNERPGSSKDMTMIQMKEARHDEGDYMAALKGSKSYLWQQRIKAVNASKLSSSDGGSSGGGGVAPDKMCPCGLGTCNVFTANTERNRGRSFYKCPQRQENGGCGYFQWCDSDPSATNNAEFGRVYVSNSMFPDLQCPCGAGPCLILTAKKGNNIGQQFYKCPADQGSSCGFFKWCNDMAAPGVPATACKVNINVNESSNKSYGVRTGSSCFKCGMEGHWAKDCSVSSSDSPAAFTASSGSSGTCYKCGKPGHWARDCISGQYTKVPQQY